ncbi:MAG TPA: chloride channel protein [Candidatus Obscuribacterales bacterium]
MPALDGDLPAPNSQAQPASKFDPSVSRAGYLPIIEALIIGTVAGLSAIVLLNGIKTVGAWRIAMSTRYPAIIVLPGIGLVGGLLAGLLVHLAPEVSGSGIPQVRALLSRINLKLDLKSAVVKLLGGVIALGSGLFMGREGPTVQVGAALAAQLSRWLPTSAQHRRELIAAGAGAGLAAAFNAPIAGVTFVLEELLKEVTPHGVSIALIACFSAAVVENLMGNARAHSAISHPGAPAPVHLIDIAFYALLGLLAAFFGGAFNTLIMGFLRAYKQSRLPTFVRTSFAGLLTGIIVASLPVIFHNYAEARQLINSATVPPDMVPTAFAAYFALVLIAYGSGAPGGLFAPSLVLGAALGYIVGFAHWQFTGNNLIDIFTQVGMGAFFAAVARVPLTASVIVFEMSGNFSLIAPLMIASVIGSAAAEKLRKGSLYDDLMVWSGIHLYGPRAQKEAKTIRVFEVMDHELPPGRLADYRVSVSPYDNLEDILFLFGRYGFDWLPVTDDQKVLGTVKRSTVLESLFPGSDQLPLAV